MARALKEVALFPFFPFKRSRASGQVMGVLSSAETHSLREGLLRLSAVDVSDDRGSESRRQIRPIQALSHLDVNASSLSME